MSDVFISYAKEDLAKAEAIAKALEKEGWSVWWDRTIPTGRDFAEVIEEAIGNTKCVVVLWSSHSVRSRWVQTEAAEGANRHVLMPVLIEDIKVPFEFRRIQAADFNGWDGQLDSPIFRKFVRDVSDILGLAPRGDERQSVSFPSNVAKEKAESSKQEAEATHAAIEDERKRAEAQARQKAEEDKSRRLEEQSRREAEEQKRKQAEAQARQQAGADRLKRLEEQLRREAEEEKRKQAEAQASLKAEGEKRKRPEGQVRRETAEEKTRQQQDQANCWWLVLFLPLLSIGCTVGSLWLELDYFAIPIAAWIGYRYRRSGLRVLAVGLLPLWIGSPNISGFALLHAPYLYIVSLVVCWGFADAGRWWRRLAALDVTIPFLVGLFILGGFELGLISDSGPSLGWRGNVVLIAVGAFIVGLTGKALKATAAVAIAMTALGMTLRGILPGRWVLEDLGGGLELAGGYSYDSLAKLLLVLVLLRFGRMVGEALRGSVRRTVFPSSRGYLSFALLWLASTHVLLFQVRSLEGPARVFGLLGEAWLTLGMAFIAGVAWQRRGRAVVGIVLSLTVLEALLVSSSGGFDWMLATGAVGRGNDVQLSLRLPEFGSQLSVYLAAVAFWFLGCRLADGLGFAPVLQPQQSPFAKWTADESGSESIRLSVVDRMVPWILVPLMPLLTYSHSLSRDLSLRFELLIVPFGAWLAYRYGRNGLIAFAVGGATYCLGWNVATGLFRLSPDLYFVALLVAWVIVHPERALEKLRGLELSNFARVAVVGLLPIGVAYYFGDLQFGLPTNGLYPYVLFVLGWAGTPMRSTLGLIGGFGGIGLALHFLLPDFGMDPLRVWYWPNSIGGILCVALYYLAGVVLNHLSFGTSSRSRTRLGETTVEVDREAERSARAVVNWSVSKGGYIGLGVIMFMALVDISMKLASITSDIWYGDDLLLMFAAFMAGTLWGNRGMQLTLGVVALLSFIIVLGWLSPIAASLSGGIGIGPLVFRFPTRPDKIFPLVAFSALLYAFMGMRLATWLIVYKTDDPTLRGNGMSGQWG